MGIGRFFKRKPEPAPELPAYRIMGVYKTEVDVRGRRYRGEPDYEADISVSPPGHNRVYARGDVVQLTDGAYRVMSKHLVLEEV